MEKNVETFRPSRLYARTGLAALAFCAICALCGLRAPLAFIPGALCGVTAAGLFWLASRPPVQTGDTQFNIGERAIAWCEVREINSSRFVSPLVLRLKLTNSRRRWLVFPGEPEQIAKLMYQLKKGSYLAKFDGVAYRDYWTCISLEASPEGPIAEQPVRMLSADEEDEIESMYQKLKSVGHLDSRSESAASADED